MLTYDIPVFHSETKCPVWNPAYKLSNRIVWSYKFCCFVLKINYGSYVKIERAPWRNTFNAIIGNYHDQVCIFPTEMVVSQLLLIVIVPSLPLPWWCSPKVTQCPNPNWPLVAADTVTSHPPPSPRPRLLQAITPPLRQQREAEPPVVVVLLLLRGTVVKRVKRDKRNQRHQRHQRSYLRQLLSKRVRGEMEANQRQRRRVKVLPNRRPFPQLQRLRRNLLW